jgi:3',5'-cyclic AMP phosphodiesterase CpdA
LEKILLITDTHITEEGALIIGLDPAARLQAVLDAALDAHGDAAALVILGDLTHNGTVTEYRRLKPLLDTVPIPVIPMLGNHDRRETFIEVFPHAPQENGFVQAVRDIGTTRLITLDSLDGPPYPDDHHAGRLCGTRLRFLETSLATRAGRQAIICIHHPPFKTGIAGMDRIRLAEGDAFLDLLARHGDLHLVCGHVHRTISGSARGVPWTVLKSPCHQGVLDLKSPNSHLSTNEPGAYGVAILMADGIVIHSEDVGLKDVRIFGGYDPD